MKHIIEKIDEKIYSSALWDFYFEGLDTGVLDIETTGLSRQRNKFILGCIYLPSKGELHQILAQNRDEESAVLAEYMKLVGSVDVVVTYNGRKFDIPFLAGRVDRYSRSFSQNASQKTRKKATGRLDSYSGSVSRSASQEQDEKLNLETAYKLSNSGNASNADNMYKGSGRRSQSGTEFNETRGRLQSELNYGSQTGFDHKPQTGFDQGSQIRFVQESQAGVNTWLQAGSNLRMPVINEYLPYNLDILLVLSNHSPIKKLVPNMKQKTIERYMGFWNGRTDEISGAESVELYNHYERTGDPEAERKILLHNSDDVKQLTRLTKAIIKSDFHKAMFHLGFPVCETSGSDGMKHSLIVEKIKIERECLRVCGIQKTTAAGIFGEAVYENITASEHAVASADSVKTPGKAGGSLNSAGDSDNSGRYGDLSETPGKAGGSLSSAGDSDNSGRHGDSGKTPGKASQFQHASGSTYPVSYIGFATGTYPVYTELSGVDSSFEFRMPVTRYMGVTAVDLETAGLDINQFESLPTYGSGFLVLQDSEGIKYMEINLFIKVYIKKFIREEL